MFDVPIQFHSVDEGSLLKNFMPTEFLEDLILESLMKGIFI